MKVGVPSVYMGLLCLLGGGLALGLASLVQLRLERGDAYPKYSTNRYDALGCRGLYEALALLSRLEVASFNQVNQTIREPSEVTLFYLGVRPPVSLAKKWFEFVEAGGHLVWSVGDPGSLASEVTGPRSSPRESRTSKSKLDVAYRRSPGSRLLLQESHRLVLEDEELPTLLPRFGEGHFESLSDEWEVVYESAGVPTILRRNFGAGVVTLLSDTYALSNEAMIKEPSPAFIRWLLLDRSRILFDETHLGVWASPGMVGLMRRYRLLPMYLSLIAIALLVCWRASSSLLPKLAAAEAGVDPGGGAGMRSDTGMVNLLRRHVGQKQILRVCVDRWLGDGERGRNDVERWRSEFGEIVADVEGGKIDLVLGYRRMTARLSAERQRRFKEREGSHGT
jgi:hypothetical protein